MFGSPNQNKHFYNAISEKLKIIEMPSLIISLPFLKNLTMHLKIINVQKYFLKERITFETLTEKTLV